jgi:uncharacterized cupredoxin-like copper-binding protein
MKTTMKWAAAWSLLAVPIMATAQAPMHQGHAPVEQHAGHAGHEEQALHSPGMSHGTQVGREGRPQDVTRTFMIEMHDQNRFSPNRVELQAGETVRFFLRNAGQRDHEFVIGTQQELREHAKMMQTHPQMVHKDPNMMRLKPRQRGGIVWHFDQPGTYYFGCLEPGHFEAGMVGIIVVK